MMALRRSVHFIANWLYSVRLCWGSRVLALGTINPSRYEYLKTKGCTKRKLNQNVDPFVGPQSNQFLLMTKSFGLYCVLLCSSTAELSKLFRYGVIMPAIITEC